MSALITLLFVVSALCGGVCMLEIAFRGLLRLQAITAGAAGQAPPTAVRNHAGRREPAPSTRDVAGDLRLAA